MPTTRQPRRSTSETGDAAAPEALISVKSLLPWQGRGRLVIAATAVRLLRQSCSSLKASLWALTAASTSLTPLVTVSAGLARMALLPQWRGQAKEASAATVAQRDRKS